jgi:SAM-dependent methyltransferase
MSGAEDSYGTLKRLAFCERVIAERRPRLVLDVGCGTGAHLTRPLAERFPATRFVGIDADARSIAFARAAGRPPNLEFATEDALGDYRDADVVIASEVVEHVEAPESFLAALRAKLAEDGTMVITLPNGRGPFELAALAQALLQAAGLLGTLRRLKRTLVGGAAEAESGAANTLAESPHVNFFTYRQVRALFEAAGFRIAEYQPRTFLCGFGFDALVNAAGLAAWNARVTDALPASLASAWMFQLEKAPARGEAPVLGGAFTRLRRRLNRHGAAPATP